MAVRGTGGCCSLMQSEQHKALGQVGCEEEASEQCKEEAVTVPDLSFTPGTVTPAAAEKLWGGE